MAEFLQYIRQKRAMLSTLYNMLSDHGRDLVNAASGALVYFMYGVYAKKHHWKRGLLTFVVGTVFAKYLGPLVGSVLPILGRDVAVFMVGMMGMRITDALLVIDYRELLRRLIDSKVK